MILYNGLKCIVNLIQAVPSNDVIEVVICENKVLTILTFKNVFEH